MAAEYQGKLLTVNMHGRRVNAEVLERHGASYIGKHAADLATWEDPFFRGIDLRFGPDGQLYIIDWSDTGECHESTGVHRTSGRIYRIRYAQAGVGAKVNAAQGKSTRAEPTAAWRVLQSADGATAATDEWLRLLDDRDEHVRVSAIRRLTDNWPLDTLLGPHPRAVKVVDEKIRIALIRAAQQDQSGLVQLTLASVLQRLPVQHRAELAKELLQRTELATDRYFPLLVWYGLIPVGNQSPKTIAELAVSNRIPILQRYMARMLTTQAETDARPLNHMLTQIYRAGGAPLEEALTGMTQAYQGVRKAKAPEVWSELARSAETTTPAIKRLVQRLNVIYGDGVALDELRKVVLDNKEEMQLRQQALASLIEARPADLQRLCQSVLDIRVLNATALRGLGLVDDPATARSVALKIKRFQPDDRPAVIEWLVSRASSAMSCWT